MIAKEISERPTVLVVDDEPMITTILTAVLHKAGYSVLAANGSREAFDICRKPESQIGLAVIDYLMPDQNGMELARCIQELRPKIRIVMMSGYTGPEMMGAGDIPCEIQGFLSKPFRVEAAVECVRQAFACPLAHATR